MQPIGLTFKRTRDKYARRQGELMLVHCCTACGGISINRIAADDDPDSILALMESNERLPQISSGPLDSTITLVKPEQVSLVKQQLFGQIA